MHQVLYPGRDVPGVISRQGCRRCYLQAGLCCEGSPKEQGERNRNGVNTYSSEKPSPSASVKVAGVLFLTDQPRTHPTRSHTGLQLCMYHLNRKNSHEKANKGAGRDSKVQSTRNNQKANSQPLKPPTSDKPEPTEWGFAQTLTVL